MPDFLHGVEVIDVADGIRPINIVRSSVIGLIGTAPLADPDIFPLNTPVVIAGERTKASALGADGTLAQAVDDIFDQIGAVIIVVRVPEDVFTPNAPIIGLKDSALADCAVTGVSDVDGTPVGVNVFTIAEQITGFAPKLLVAPGFVEDRPGGLINPVMAELVSKAEVLNAIVIADGPGTTLADEITYAGDFSSERVYIVGRHVIIATNAGNIVAPGSARIAGLFAKVDSELGFWNSPSNKVINGVIGIEKPFSFQLNNANTQTNLLNESKVASIINSNGIRLWGNRTTSSDTALAFVNVVRTRDIISESLFKAHQFAVDQNITATFVETIVDSVQAFLDDLKAQGAILGGEVIVDPELNSPTQLQVGNITFDFEFTPATPAERITFRRHLTNRFFESVV